MSGFQAADPESHDAIIRDFITGMPSTCIFAARRFVRTGTASAESAEAAAEYLSGTGAFAWRRAALSSGNRRARPVRRCRPHRRVRRINSKVRSRHAAVFRPDIAAGKCRFIWLGTRQQLAAFTFAFEKTEHGWFQIHAYQFSDDVSTVIVETREETWRAHGLDACTGEQSIAFCESLSPSIWAAID